MNNEHDLRVYDMIKLFRPDNPKYNKSEFELIKETVLKVCNLIEEEFKYCEDPNGDIYDIQNEFLSVSVDLQKLTHSNYNNYLVELYEKGLILKPK